MNSVILSFILTKIMVFFVEDVVMITIPDAKSRDFAEMCPQNCTCYNATIDCSKRNLTELPKFISYNTSILDLSGNQLKSLPLSFFDNLWNLQVINVSYNEIEELGTIGNDQHLKKSWKLHTIDLSHNKIQQINMYFPRFKGLRKLILSYNLLQEITPASFLNVPYLEQLFLDHNQLRSLTRLWFVVKSNLKSLHLMYNNISFIEPSTFYYTEDISLIDLSGNFIKYLDSGLFLELQKLSHLYLDCNIISHISEFAFTGLDQLLVLNLSSNHISVGDKEMDTAFIPLKRLEVLDLSKNSALLIPSTAFQGLANLKTLNLMFNNIMVIEEKAFENLKSLKLLELSTSSLLCGCSVKWLRDWLNLHPMGKNINIACSLPLWLKNKNVMDILDSELSCGSTEFSPIRPKITLQPQSTFANKLGNTSLKCSAVSLMQTMDIVWFKNNLIIDKAKVSNTIQIVNEIQYECTSVLVLKNIKNEDNGAYSCYASNLYGSDLSTRVNISVVEPPRLSSELKPIIISRSGETVLIPCKAEGQPLPSISFTKLNYRQNIHAFVDKRVSYNNHMFGITNLKIEDSGLYVCCAKNVAGFANKTITLTVLEKPKFTHPMDSKAVLLGDTAVLNCIVSGNPPPKIQWYKNDTLLYPDLSSRIKLSNLWLVIVSFDYSDEGSYGCEASNSLGTARQTARLTVHNKTLLGLSSKKSPFLSIVIITVVAVVILISFALVSLFCFKKRHKNKEELADDKLLGNLPKAYTLHYTDKLTPVPVSKSVSLKEEAPYLSDSKDDSDNWTLDSAMAVDLAEDDSGISLVYPKDNCSGNITVDRCIDPRVHSFSVEKLNEALQIKNISSYSTLRSSHRKQSNCYLLFNSLNSSLVDRTTDIPLISLKNNNSALVAHKKNKILRDVCDSSLLKYDKTFVGVVPKAPTLKEKYLASSRIESEFISNASLSESLMIGKTRVS